MLAVKWWGYVFGKSRRDLRIVCRTWPHAGTQARRFAVLAGHGGSPRTHRLFSCRPLTLIWRRSQGRGMRRAPWTGAVGGWGTAYLSDEGDGYELKINVTVDVTVSIYLKSLIIK